LRKHIILYGVVFMKQFQFLNDTRSLIIYICIKNQPGETQMRILLILLITYGSSFGVMFVKWNFPMTGTYSDWMIYSSTPAIAELGVNSTGGEPDNFLEIIIGSDEASSPYSTFGVWRCIDALGNLEWYLDTRTDEARSSPAIADFWGEAGSGDGVPDIVGGTTSGWSVEAFSFDGSYFWRFANIVGSGAYLWHSSPAVADMIPSVAGMEIVIGNSNNECPAVFCLEGDISDGIDDGYIGYDSFDHSCWDTSLGSDGAPDDWDVLWFHNTSGPIISTPAIGDISNDGQNEIVIGTGWTSRWLTGAHPGTDGRILCLDGATGARRWALATGGPDSQVPASPAIADIDSDGDLEIFIGAGDGYFYCIDGDENSSGTILFNEIATKNIGGRFYSSAAVGDVDGDGQYEIIVGDPNGNLTCMSYRIALDSVEIEWETHISESTLISSPALCVAHDSIPWLQFRHNAQRTGFYPPVGEMAHIFIGTMEGDLVHLTGDGAEVERINIGKSIVTSPVIADIDKDCYLEVVIMAASITGIKSDTLWCIGTDIPSGLAGCDECDTIDVWVVCPNPCNTFSSCENQDIVFGIGFDIGDPLDTMKVYVSYVAEIAGIGTLMGDIYEPSTLLDFLIISPNEAMLTVHPPVPGISDGDMVTITVDSLFSVGDCKTIPEP